jgi:hypothetical protein
VRLARAGPRGAEVRPLAGGGLEAAHVHLAEDAVVPVDHVRRALSGRRPGGCTRPASRWPIPAGRRTARHRRRTAARSPGCCRARRPGRRRAPRRADPRRSGST